MPQNFQPLNSHKTSPTSSSNQTHCHIHSPSLCNTSKPPSQKQEAISSKLTLMASTSAVSMAMPPVCSSHKKVGPPTPTTFFQPLPLRPSNKANVVSSIPSSKFVVRASLKEKAVTGLTAAALTASMMVPDVAEAATLSPSLKNFLLSIAAGGVVLAAIVGAVIGVANFDPVKRG